MWQSAGMPLDKVREEAAGLCCLAKQKLHGVLFGPAEDFTRMPPASVCCLHFLPNSSWDVDEEKRMCESFM